MPVTLITALGGRINKKGGVIIQICLVRAKKSTEKQKKHCPGMGQGPEKKAQTTKKNIVQACPKGHKGLPSQNPKGKARASNTKPKDIVQV